jgi:hypothetical protein
MWKMRLLKSTDLYRKNLERPWRISLLMFPDGEICLEMTCPQPDVEKIRLKALSRADYEVLVDIIVRAVRPDRIVRSIEKGWI